MSSTADSPAANFSEDESRTKWSTNSPNSTTDSSMTRFETKVSTLLHVSNTDNDAATTVRKSAFQPYRPIGKVLTNLQRGNTEATFCTNEALSFHERAGQGELTEEHLRAEYARLGNDKERLDSRDKHGFTALHWAAFYGQLNVVQLLLNIGHATVDALAPEMVTPLLLAASAGHNDVVRLLLEHDANVAHMDIIGNTALMYAAAGNHPHTCHELLTRNCDITVENENGDTAYSLAVENGATLAQSVLEHFLMTLIPL